MTRSSQKAFFTVLDFTKSLKKYYIQMLRIKQEKFAKKWVFKRLLKVFISPHFDK